MLQVNRLTRHPSPYSRKRPSTPAGELWLRAFAKRQQSLSRWRKLGNIPCGASKRQSHYPLFQDISNSLLIIDLVPGSNLRFQLMHLVLERSQSSSCRFFAVQDNGLQRSVRNSVSQCTLTI
jgi:hypothetical protein